jgi:hypothetical protein
MCAKKSLSAMSRLWARAMAVNIGSDCSTARPGALAIARDELEHPLLGFASPLNGSVTAA